jgi:putative tryptophan/tyrosine transport system substrate-binding protein
MDRTGRRQFLGRGLALAGLGLLSGCGILPPQALQPAKVRRIGFLAHPTIPDAWIDQFREELAARGWVEGETFLIERRFTDGREERLPELAAELIGLPVDVIVTRGAPPAYPAKALTGSIPIVVVGSGDPVGQGLVASLNRPGGNVTGPIESPVELGAKCLELLKESFPAISRVAVLFNPRTPGPARQWQIVHREAAPKLGLTVQAVELPEPDDLEAAFAATGAGVDALLVIHDAVLLPHAARIAALAARTRLPAIYEAPSYVADAGGLMSYQTYFPDGGYRRAAIYVDKILKGANPGELAMEAPTHFRLTINRRTERALGRTIAPSVLQQATEVIE